MSSYQAAIMECLWTGEPLKEVTGTALKSTQVLLHINFMYKFFIALERLHLVYIAILQN